MPFKNKAQMRACFAKKDPKWDCKKWIREGKKAKGGKMGNCKHAKMQRGGSIVDYMTERGVDASYKNRKKMFNDVFQGKYRGSAEQNIQLLNMLRSGDLTLPGSLESGVEVNKRTNEATVYQNFKPVKKFPVLTGRNPNAEKNTYTNEEIEANFNLAGTPQGDYMMTPQFIWDQGVYGMQLSPLQRNGKKPNVGNMLFMHPTYPGREKMYNTNNRYRSNGCINCEPENMENIFQQFPFGDTLRVNKNRYQTGGRKIPDVPSNFNELVDWTTILYNLFEVPPPPPKIDMSQYAPPNPNAPINPRDIPPDSAPIINPNDAPDASVTTTTTKRDWDPRGMLRSATTAASFIGNLLENKRQDQYMYNQYSTLGQLDAIPVSNFQPTRYTPYMQRGGRAPIIVNDPRDKRLQAYKDSMLLYETTAGTIDQLKNAKSYMDWINTTKGWGSLYNNATMGAFWRLANMNKKKPTGTRDYERIFPDFGFGATSEFKKPTQSVIYEKPINVPMLGPKVDRVTNIPNQMRFSTLGTPSMPNLRGDGSYSFSMRNPDGTMDTEVFPNLDQFRQFTDLQGYEHRRISGDEKTASGTGYRKFLKGGRNANQPTRYTPYMQKGGRAPIIVNDPNDPRLQRYKDSLTLYNYPRQAYETSEKAEAILMKLIENNQSYKFDELWPKLINTKESKEFKRAVTRLSKYNKNDPFDYPIKGSYMGHGLSPQSDEYPVYKKPVQPVRYEQPMLGPKVDRVSNIENQMNFSTLPVPTAPNLRGDGSYSFSMRNPDGTVDREIFPTLDQFMRFTDLQGYEHRTVTDTGKKAHGSGYRKFLKGGRNAKKGK